MHNQKIHQVSGESVTSSTGRNTEAKLIINSVFSHQKHSWKQWILFLLKLITNRTCSSLAVILCLTCSNEEGSGMTLYVELLVSRGSDWKWIFWMQKNLHRTRCASEMFPIHFIWYYYKAFPGRKTNYCGSLRVTDAIKRQLCWAEN